MVGMPPHLPIPEIHEDTVFQHSFKEANRRTTRLCPPTPKPARYLPYTVNRSNSSSRFTPANAISFRSGNQVFSGALSLPLNASQSSDNQSYFDQCFTVLDKIGEGSFGEVFKVRSKDDGLLYAVKMSKQLFRSEKFRKERLEEVRRYEQFSGHANCVSFYQAWEQDERLYMKMELCRESLEQYLARNVKIAEKKIWSILLDLLLALKSLHDRNLIHLDIKLDNVLIGDDSSCKLADFGLVIDVLKANHNATEGDSRYIAPEIMQGIFSKAADVFSLGIAMLELSCNLELPSNGPLWQQLRSGILPEDFIKDISTDLQMIIKQMMAPVPSERPTVDDLLKRKHFLDILKYRNRWKFVKNIKHGIRISRRAIWSKMCNLKKTFLRLYSYMSSIQLKMLLGLSTRQILNKNNRKMSIISSQITSSSTPANKSQKTLNDLLNSDNISFELSEQETSSNQFSNSDIINSTPILSNYSRFRNNSSVRQKLSFDAEDCVRSTPTSAHNITLPNISDELGGNLLRTFRLSRTHIDTSSLSRKRLFSDSNE